MKPLELALRSEHATLAAMKHTLICYGWYDHGWRHFHVGQDHYWRKSDDPEKPAVKEVERPGPDFDGLRFGFFQKTDYEYLYVSVDDRALPQPVLHVPGRHGVEAPGPSFVKLSDDAAANILVDMIVANPAFRDALGRLLRNLPLAVE